MKLKLSETFVADWVSGLDLGPSINEEVRFPFDGNGYGSARVDLRLPPVLKTSGRTSVDRMQGFGLKLENGELVIAPGKSVKRAPGSIRVKLKYDDLELPKKVDLEYGFESREYGQDALAESSSFSVGIELFIGLASGVLIVAIPILFIARKKERNRDDELRRKEHDENRDTKVAKAFVALSGFISLDAPQGTRDELAHKIKNRARGNLDRLVEEIMKDVDRNQKKTRHQADKKPLSPPERGRMQMGAQDELNELLQRVRSKDDEIVELTNQISTHVNQIHELEKQKLNPPKIEEPIVQSGGDEVFTKIRQIVEKIYPEFGRFFEQSPVDEVIIRMVLSDLDGLLEKCSYLLLTEGSPNWGVCSDLLILLQRLEEFYPAMENLSGKGPISAIQQASSTLGWRKDVVDWFEEKSEIKIARDIQLFKTKFDPTRHERSVPELELPTSDLRKYFDHRAIDQAHACIYEVTWLGFDDGSRDPR